MKKEYIPKLLFAAAGLLFIGFCIRLGADHIQYTTTLNSAPFWVWILVRALEFLLPASIILIVGLVLRKKYQ